MDPNDLRTLYRHLDGISKDIENLKSRIDNKHAEIMHVLRALEERLEKKSAPR